MATDQRLRLVVMGDSFVGKSSIVKRFLFGSYAEKYTATVEDLYTRDYEFGGNSLKVDILDTSGDCQFPAMRRLSITSAHAFLLVYSVTDETSFWSVKQRINEIREQRSDFQDIPIVVAGNKIDLVREVDQDDVIDWVTSEMSKQRTEVIDCSAAKDDKVVEIFRAFLRLSKINFGPKTGGGKVQDDAGVGLRRNLSAYGRLKSPKKCPPKPSPLAAEPLPMTTRGPHPALAADDRKGSNEQLGLPGSPLTPRSERKFLGLSLSPFGSSKHLDHLISDSQNEFKPSPNSFAPGRNSKRSRSLIRRSSKKVKQQMNNVHSADDCVIS